MRHGLRGQTFGVVSACAAGAHAIGPAMRMIESGDADAVVTGGAEAALTPLARRPSRRWARPRESGISPPLRPPPRRLRDGRGRGHAGARGGRGAPQRARRRASAEMLGYGATSDAYHLTAPEPDGRGAARGDRARARRRRARARRGRLRQRPRHLDPAQRPLRDRGAEGGARRARDEAAGLARPSRRSATCSAPPARSRRSRPCHALRERIAPPTLGYEEPDEGLDLDYVPDDARAARQRQRQLRRRLVAISNSFGFGGHNAVLCLRAP